MVKEQNLSVPTLLHPPGPGVVLGHPLSVVLQGEDARRGHDPRLAHAPAEGLAQFAGPAMKYQVAGFNCYCTGLTENLFSLALDKSICCGTYFWHTG